MVSTFFIIAGLENPPVSKYSLMLKLTLQVLQVHNFNDLQHNI
jgi:hypothetical protein